MTTPSPRIKIRRYLIPAAAAVLSLAVTAGVIDIVGAGGTADTATSAASDATPTPPSSRPSSAAPSNDPEPAGRAPLPSGSAQTIRVFTGRTSAREPLRRLAATLTASRADTERGAFEYVAEQQWAGSTTVIDRVGTTAMIPMTHQRWRAADRSGHKQTREYPPGTEPSTWSALPRHTVRINARYFDPGELPGPADLGADRGTVTAAITSRTQPENGIMDVVRAVDELYRDRAPRLTTRAAILDILADADLDWTGPDTDKLGRACLTVSIDTRTPRNPGVSRDLLQLDPATGEVTGYEHVLLTNPGGLTGRFPQTADLHLYTTRDRRATVR
ncbi:hypothetical protein DMB66_54960 [Actinoplanes sp. ATCC 53533]|uniref:hypothetical protein n=1 Tax=Actinoplanes sp. ATCC 53533 TaxID=1288362 RepID=UPI000F77A77F|nr:hypothetical protein [Actinoplanes sp. ATCC 53533]RSM42200.1 hypothetical protein DMB66_54960 [Actinoplanes sp. ATCC 53533]